MMSFFDEMHPIPTPDSTEPGMADGWTEITNLNISAKGIKILRQIYDNLGNARMTSGSLWSVYFSILIKRP
jgi:hypothetical protein